MPSRDVERSGTGRFYTLGPWPRPGRRDARARARRAQHDRLRRPADPRQGRLRRGRRGRCPCSPGATSSRPLLIALLERGPRPPLRERRAALGDRLRLRLQLDRLLPRPRADPGLGDRARPLHLPRDRGAPRRARRRRAAHLARAARRRSAPSPAARSPPAGSPARGAGLRLSGVAWALAAALVYASLHRPEQPLRPRRARRGSWRCTSPRRRRVLCVALALADGGLALPLDPRGLLAVAGDRASSRRWWP